MYGKFGISEILLPILNNEETASPFVYPEYKMIIKITKGYKEISFVDTNCNNLLITSKCEKLGKCKLESS